MPGKDGLEVCKRIRDHISCPILFLTARIEDTDKVKGFTVGGDDYIVKPFSLMELEARVRAHLRREARHNFEAQVKFSGDLTIDYSERCLFFGDKRVGLAKKEFDIVELLSQNPGQIFDKERIYERNIILTSKYGKTKCATAKVVAGIITAILTTTLIAAFNLLLAFVFYGTEGLDCSILFAPSDYVEAFIPFNITCGTLLKYQILLAFTCTLSVTGITLFLSAISKNQIVALVAAMAIFLFPVLLPITEVNPLFRLVGLLPIYHVLAISLLSVEQMSNGMLYAIWAIPAALLFLGVGAGISRRVFAKHQVL